MVRRHLMAFATFLMQAHPPAQRQNSPILTVCRGGKVPLRTRQVNPWPIWLGEEPADPKRRKALLAPYPGDDMICCPESVRVGSVKTNDPSLIEPVVLP
jgi:hypothetical protein